VSATILTPRPLTAEAFAPFGVVFELGKDRPGPRDAYAAPMENLRDAATLNVSISRPKPVALPLKVEWLERHPFSSQTFVPLDLSRHLLLGCPSLPDGGPNIAEAVTFIGAANQGIMYRHNVWHHPFAALDRNGETVMLRYDDGGDMDTEWFQVEDGPTIHDIA
jgi:ureidoglycolate lyase